MAIRKMHYPASFHLHILRLFVITSELIYPKVKTKFDSLSMPRLVFCLLARLACQNRGQNYDIGVKVAIEDMECSCRVSAAPQVSPANPTRILTYITE